MRIENSSVAMASNHKYVSYSRVKAMTMEASVSSNLPQTLLTINGQTEDASYMERMQEYRKQQESDAMKEKRQNEENAARMLSGNMGKTRKANGQCNVSDRYKLQLELIKKLFGFLKEKRGFKASDLNNLNKDGILDLRSSKYQSEDDIYKLAVADALPIGTNSVGTMWQRVTAISGYSVEAESSTFVSSGKVQTAEGKSIDFNIEVSMSRAFTSKIDALECENFIMTDPLMINLNTNIGKVTDQKFLFDLDSDGKEEEMSFAGSGSGFLALDKNGDGIINDGSELFGTQSGDGFKDLAMYDKDKNGWIDENDDIFSKLRIWVKDENGNDQLLSLKQADVGAIYLGNSDTEFTLKNDKNQTNGAIRQTGIYLHESSGKTGTINHVDLAI